MDKLNKIINILFIIVIIFAAMILNGLENKLTARSQKQSAQEEQEKINKIDALIVPNLNDPTMIMVGAGQFAEHCVRCHSMAETEGLNGRRASFKYLDFSLQYPMSPKDEYRMIRYGRLFAMPKFVDHDNGYSTWSTIAFLQRMSDLTPQQYHNLVARAPKDRDGLEKD